MELFEILRWVLVLSTFGMAIYVLISIRRSNKHLKFLNNYNDLLRNENQKLTQQKLDIDKECCRHKNEINDLVAENEMLKQQLKA